MEEARLRKDHRPYAVKQLLLRVEKRYARHFIRPQFETLGRGCTFMKPWHVQLFGAPIALGDYATVIGAPDGKVRLSVWSRSPGRGRIRIGRYALICPGVRLSSAEGIDIGDNCMLANRVYISDSDWHDLYNRIGFGKSSPVTIGDNVWVGDGAIISKGVAIGGNAVVGAGAVVMHDIPANCVAAGNPARVVKTLDPAKPMVTRQQWFADPHRLAREFSALDREMLAGNSMMGWLRALLFPTRSD
jgi:acetyltransferase-like isoleucine patch superfamily enzyme